VFGGTTVGLHRLEELDQVVLRAEEGRQSRDEARPHGPSVDGRRSLEGAAVPFTNRSARALGRLLLEADPDTANPSLPYPQEGLRRMITGAASLHARR